MDPREDPVLGVLRRRAAAGSTPGRRRDGHVVSLAIEGGGMRGVVSAGMCAVLEEAEPIPFVTALAEGSSHVLVLRSRPATFRVRTRSRLSELAVGRAHPGLRPVVQASGDRYNRDADRLAESAHHAEGPAISQIGVPASSRLVGRLSTDPGRIAESLRLGATAMATALYGEPTRLMWRPTPVVDLDADARSAA